MLLVDRYKETAGAGSQLPQGSSSTVRTIIIDVGVVAGFDSIDDTMLMLSAGNI